MIWADWNGSRPTQFNLAPTVLDHRPRHELTGIVVTTKHKLSMSLPPRSRLVSAKTVRDLARVFLDFGPKSMFPLFTRILGITGRMMTVFDTEHQRACDAMIQENYFVQTCLPPKMHLKSSAADGTAPYHVVFALDKSGSMWGTKLDQTKEAFRSMISSLDREARFSIIGFNYDSSPWRTRLVKASPYNVEEARGFISRLSAGGGTNMHAALIDAVEVQFENFRILIMS